MDWSTEGAATSGKLAYLVRRVLVGTHGKGGERLL
jgi:hypothetical protein